MGCEQSENVAHKDLTDAQSNWKRPVALSPGGIRNQHFFHISTLYL